MARIAPVNAKGTRDFLPRDLVERNRVFSLLRETFESYGYEPLETPAVENTSVLEGKYGEEGERLLFRILKRGESLEKAERSLVTGAAAQGYSASSLQRALSDEALRYDLTVPLARVIAAHQNDLVFPFRRYQMQTVWRADRPQHGRYREFYQCDVDCVGSSSLTLDAEMIAVHAEVFVRLGFTSFLTKVNHRGLLQSLMTACEIPEAKRAAALTALDKLDKIGRDGVESELGKLDLGSVPTERLLDMTQVSGTPQAIIEVLRPSLAHLREGMQALDDLAEIFEYIGFMGVPPERVTFDLSMVRGLGYYTGAIFETVLTDAIGSQLGSLGGGGRYDHLIGQFTGRDLPCVGISFGVERIVDALRELHIARNIATTTTQALVALFSRETLGPSLSLAQKLRAAGIHTEVSPEVRELGRQLSFANKKGIPLAVILGPDEIAAGTVRLHDLAGRSERIARLEDSVSEALAMLASHSGASPTLSSE